MKTFAELAASRREWIETVLRPWCARASRKELRLAEMEWGDLAGRVDPEATLWTWAWGRFPELVHEGLSGVSETREVRVRLADGREIVGYPDGRQSKQGELVLLARTATGRIDEQGPFSIDEIAAVEVA